MQSICQPKGDGTCSQCDEPLPDKLRRGCRAKVRTPYQGPKPPGIGDLTKEFFQSIGITEERYKAVKEAVHLDPNCKCNARQEWLNAMGEQLGLNQAADAFARWFQNRRKLDAR